MSPSLLELKDSSGSSLLILSVQTGNIDMVRYLLSAGASVNSQNVKMKEVIWKKKKVNI